ncbi:unnamed protein product [Clavelina lepadiformis]|uniref:HMG box domain-containing protein n=1 Tax=Clavelina lepadiformis TaxID=159417 RepID=A0ABP0G0A9_CLALP
MDGISQHYLQPSFSSTADASVGRSVNVGTLCDYAYCDESKGLLNNLESQDTTSALQLLNEPYPGVTTTGYDHFGPSAVGVDSQQHSRYHPYEQYVNTMEPVYGTMSQQFVSSSPGSLCQTNYPNLDPSVDFAFSAANPVSQNGTTSFPICHDSNSQWQSGNGGQFDMNSNNNNINGNNYQAAQAMPSFFPNSQGQDNGCLQQITYSNPAPHYFSPPQYPPRRAINPAHTRVMEVESTSSSEVEFGEDSNGKRSPSGNKKRGTKKRKKKGANEPQKPVSAYALFFRDTQAAIKAENPSATFGEISKIVASMWDSLSEEAKQVYKQKTETAKRDYLKQLAAFRANLVSKGGLDADEEDSQPLSVIKMKMTDLRTPAQDHLPPLPKLQMAPVQGLPQQSISAFNAIPVVASSAIDIGGSTGINDQLQYSYVDTTGQPSNFQNSTVQQIVLRSVPTVASTSVGNPPPIQLRSIVPKANSPVTLLQSKQGQIIKVLPPSQAANIANLNDGKNRIIKMADMLRTPNIAVTQVSSSDGNGVQPILQTLAQETGTSMQETILNQNGSQQCPMIDLTDSSIYAQPNTTIASIQPSTEYPAPAARMCVRNGCTNLAIYDPQWNNEYCSSECVVHHCRDVFDAWTSVRKFSAPVN